MTDKVDTKTGELTEVTPEVIKNIAVMVAHHAGAVAEMSWTPEQIELIKSLCAAGTSDDEFAVFLYTAKRSRLDPLAKQIYAVMRKGKMAIQTGIDGFRVVADRTGKYAGVDEPTFELAENGDYPISATAVVYKMVGGQRCPFSGTARWSEYCQYTKEGNLTSFWERMPFGQLAKCAEALALRKAFPNDLSGIYTNEEMQQADNPAGAAPPDRQVAAKTSDKKAPVNKATPAKKAPTGKGGGELRKMQSKYGTVEKPNLCNVCGEYHITAGDTIILDPDINKWGSEVCYNEAKATPEEDPIAAMITEVKRLELALFQDENPDELRRAHAGEAVLEDADPNGLESYLDHLRDLTTK